MTKLEAQDLIFGAYIDALSKNYPETANKAKEIYEQQRTVAEAEQLTKEKE